MKIGGLVIGSLLVCTVALAQNKIDATKKQLAEKDSLIHQSIGKVDSIQNNFNNKADSLVHSYQRSTNKIDSLTGSYTRKLDSLQSLQLPTTKIEKKLDSLRQKQQAIMHRFTSRLDSLKGVTNTKLNSLDLPPEMQGPVNDLKKRVGQYTASSDKIPKIEIPGFNRPDLGNMKIDANIPAVTDLTKNIPGVDLPTGQLSDATKAIDGYGKDVKALAGGNLNEIKQAPDALEKKAGDLAGVSGLAEKEKAMKNAMGGGAQDPEEAKKQLLEQAQKVAVDHFAGKEEALKQAMDKISKYKQKYSSISSLEDLKKRPPNPMKGKPFIERLVPGFYLQYQQKNDWLLDVNPYAGYRLGGRIVSGLGWNQRLAYDNHSNTFNKRAAIYGPRAFTEVSVGKGFIVRAETELMNTFVPVNLFTNTDEGNREWVWGMMTGLKKEFRIYKGLKGTILMQYNLFNRHHKAPYVDRLNSRIGFEWNLRKKKRPEKKE